MQWNSFTDLNEVPRVAARFPTDLSELVSPCYRNPAILSVFRPKYTPSLNIFVTGQKPYDFHQSLSELIPINPNART